MEEKMKKILLLCTVGVIAVGMSGCVPFFEGDGIFYGGGWHGGNWHGGNWHGGNWHGGHGGHVGGGGGHHMGGGGGHGGHR
jgi:hypothetical protein